MMEGRWEVKMTELPEANRLFGRTYRTEDLPEVGRQAWNGLLDHPQGIIYLDGKLDAELLVQTILHECVHVYQIETVNPIDEAECNRLAHFIYQMLYDNSWLAKAFCDDDDDDSEDDDDSVTA